MLVHPNLHHLHYTMIKGPNLQNPWFPTTFFEASLQYHLPAFLLSEFIALSYMFNFDQSHMFNFLDMFFLLESTATEYFTQSDQTK